MPRSLDLLDLPTLYRYRGEALSLDSARLLTRGNPLSAAGLVAYFNPARHIYSAVNAVDGDVLLGGIIHTQGDSFARLLYLAPQRHLTHPGLPPLIEHLSTEAGTWGAFHILAEVDEDSDAFPALRAAGFSVYAWQRIWDISDIETDSSASVCWQKAQSVNLHAIQTLFHQIVPPLLQPVEPTPKRASGLVCNEGGHCYVSLSQGGAGVVVNPLIHPEATGVPEKLGALVSQIPVRGQKPLYLCVRSYQAWLEPVLEDLGAKSGPRQAVMVKHLARMVKNEQAVRTTQPASAIPASHIRHAQVKGKEQN
ncbi:MAG: hypothetical protein R6W69_04300 [Anaerolineales bacterium]